jgi:hypothetical protein
LKSELEKQTRDDNRELVELTLICLGVQPYTKPYKFKYPGAYHRARWKIVSTVFVGKWSFAQIQKNLHFFIIGLRQGLDVELKCGGRAIP